MYPVYLDPDQDKVTWIRCIWIQTRTKSHGSGVSESWPGQSHMNPSYLDPNQDKVTWIRCIWILTRTKWHGSSVSLPGPGQIKWHKFGVSGSWQGQSDMDSVYLDTDQDKVTGILTKWQDPNKRKVTTWIRCIYNCTKEQSDRIRIRDIDYLSESVIMLV